MTPTSRSIFPQRCSRIVRSSVLILATACAIALVLSCVSPAPAAAQTPAPFPRLAHWWGGSPLAENARRDFYVPYDDDPLHPDTGAIATLRSLNPNIILLASSSAAELDYSPSNDRTFDAQRLGAIPTSWLLTQVGSTLSAPVTSPSAGTISVADTSKFSVGDLIVIDDEKCLVTSIGGTLTACRGYAGSTAATHVSGTRVAAVVSDWPYAATLDMTAGCPHGRATGAFATPGTGTEQASDWLARRTAGIYAAADWDGVEIDVCLGNYASALRGSTSFRTIADRTAPTTEVDDATFDQAWQSGIEAFLSQVRALVGDNAIIMTNAAPAVFTTVNGTTFEGFPADSTTPLQWHVAVVGPETPYRGAYLDWCASTRTPNLSTIMTYGAVDDYRLMRFGLCTALMGDGYYAYEAATSGHSVAGRWYDEYDDAGAGKGYLGSPVGAAYTVAPALTTPDLLGGYGGFADQSALNAWTLYAHTNYAATDSLDGGTAKIQVTKSAGSAYSVEFDRPGVSVTAGKEYTLSFRARTDRSLSVQAALQQAASPYTTYTASDEIPLTTEWKTIELPLTASGTDPAAQLKLFVGQSAGTIWVDDVKLQAGDRNVYRRDYAGGVALVNASNATATVSLGGSFRKIRGTQAPSVNNGSLVTAVTLPPRDGLVLVRPVPTGTLVIAGGATQVDSANVTCTSRVSGANEMRINPGTGTFGDWMAYAASVPITLAGDHGTKTVRVEYRNPAGTTQLTATVDLVVSAQDAIPPTTDTTEPTTTTTEPPTTTTTEPPTTTTTEPPTTTTTEPPTTTTTTLPTTTTTTLPDDDESLTIAGPSTVTAGRTLWLTGTVAPADSYIQITRYRRNSAGGWDNYGRYNLTAGSDGTWSANVSTTRAGSWAFTARGAGLATTKYVTANAPSLTISGPRIVTAGRTLWLTGRVAPAGSRIQITRYRRNSVGRWVHYGRYNVTAGSDGKWSAKVSATRAGSWAFTARGAGRAAIKYVTAR